MFSPCLFGLAIVRERVNEGNSLPTHAYRKYAYLAYSACYVLAFAVVTARADLSYYDDTLTLTAMSAAM
jgi:hypothetical protein